MNLNIFHKLQITSVPIVLDINGNLPLLMNLNNGGIFHKLQITSVPIVLDIHGFINQAQL